MRILLSAYACEPGKGSEPAVGWQWAIGLARMGHEVWVLTRANNRAAIEAAADTLPETARLHFLYYDLPAALRFWKRGGRGIRLYYLLWQWGAYRLARRAHRRENFERVHHVTFVSARQPSFMGLLGIPFVFGPAAGGERAPWRLRAGFGWRGLLIDGLRDAANLLVRLDPLMAITFASADRIYVTSRQSLHMLPRRFRHKARVALAIAWDGEIRGAAGTPDHTAPRLLYVGRLIYWKGVHLALAAFRHLLDVEPEARFSIVGQGPDEARLRQLAERLGLAANVDWHPWMARDALIGLYRDYDALLYPSLHDSGGMVVLEAMASGLPVICLDLGGPGAMVDESCGRVVASAGRGQAAVCRALGDALVELAADPGLRARLAAGAARRTKSFDRPPALAQLYRDDGGTAPLADDGHPPAYGMARDRLGDRLA